VFVVEIAETGRSPYPRRVLGSDAPNPTVGAGGTPGIGRLRGSPPEDKCSG
jgi:hypothetical protein